MQNAKCDLCTRSRSLPWRVYLSTADCEDFYESSSVVTIAEGGKIVNEPLFECVCEPCLHHILDSNDDQFGDPATPRCSSCDVEVPDLFFRSWEEAGGALVRAQCGNHNPALCAACLSRSVMATVWTGPTDARTLCWSCRCNHYAEYFTRFERIQRFDMGSEGWISLDHAWMTLAT